MYVNGFQVDENFILKEDDVCTIREFPRTTGASNNAIGWEIFFGILTGGASTLVSHIYYKTKGSNMYDDLYAWYQEEMRKSILGDTDLDINNKEKESIKTNPSLLGAKNQNGFNSPYPIVLGTHLYTPKYIGMPYTTIDGTDGDTQWYHVLFLLGYSDLLVQNIKLGTLDLASNTGDTPVMNGEIPVDSLLFQNEYANGEIKIELQQGANEVSFYDEKVVQEDLQLELTCVKLNDGTLQYCPLTRFSAKNPRVVELEFTFPSLIGYDSKNNKVNADVDLKLEYSNDAGNTWYEFGQITNCTSYNSSTRTSHFSMQKAKNMRFVARKEFTITDAFAEEMLDNGRTYELRITRTSPNSIDNNVADRVYLTAIRTWCYDYTKTKENYDIAEDKTTVELVKQRPMIEQDRNRTARLGLKIKSGDKFTGTLESVNMILTSYARTWNGEEWSTTESPTNNPASLFIKLLQSPSRGNKKYLDEKLDLDSLGRLYEFCNQPMSEADSTPRYTCNTVLYNEAKTNDILSMILYTGRASLSMNGSQYGVVIDKPIENPVAILNNQNILSFSAKKSFTELPSGLRLEFINAHNGYQTDEAIVLYEGKSLDDNDLVLNKLKLNYITNPKQAVKQGYYELAKLKLRPETWVLSVSTEGNLFEVGSLIELQTDTINVGIGDGAEILELITEGNYLTGIKTDGHFVVSSLDNSYGVKVYITDGINEPHILKAKVTIDAVGEYSTLYFESPIYMLGEQSTPTVGDIVSFGEYDKITTLAICTSKGEDENGKFSCTVIPYDENVYTAESGDIPEFDSKTTSIHSSVAPSVDVPNATKSELMDEISKIESGTGTEPPSAPVNVTAVAEKDRIRLNCSAGGDGLNNAIKKFVWQYKKSADDTWHDLTTGHYYFDHKNNVDAYYEREDFSSWYFRVKAVNNYGISSTTWTNAIVNTTNYGTWKLDETIVDTPKNIDRTIILSMSQKSGNYIRERYGVVQYKVEVSRADDVNEDNERIYYKPAMNKDPYSSESNYKDGEGYVLSGENFVQIVPLKGQSTNEIENTIYYYRVTAILTDTETGSIVDTAESVEKQTFALCTNIRDIVNASKEAKDEIEVKELSSITANMGEITDGRLKGNSRNYWTLTTASHPEIKDDNRDFQGAFRVGGEDQYLLCKPVVQDGSLEPIGYEITFKVGNFELTSTTSNINGELIVQENSHSLDRTRITPDGTYYEHREAVGSNWFVVDQMNTTGAVAPAYKANNQITIGNFTQNQSRVLGHDIGREYLSENAKVYHFDSDVFDHNGNNTLVIDGDYKLKGKEDSNGIDYTPAILAVAPYSTLSKSITGQISISTTMEQVQIATIDFWQKYLYAESQELINVGTADDKIILKVRDKEPVAVSTGIVNWFDDNDNIVYTETLNVSINENVYKTSLLNTEFGKIKGIEYNEDKSIHSILVLIDQEEVFFYPGTCEMNFETWQSEELWGKTSCLINRAKLGGVDLTHQGQNQKETIDLESIGFNFDNYKWYHIGVVLSETEIKFLLNDKSYAFNRNATSPSLLEIKLNSDKKSVIIDELYLDTTDESLSDFSEQTEKRIPWAKLSYKNDWFIFDAKNTDKVKSNILDAFLNSEAFENKVKQIIGE